ncbi:MAG: YceI family protein [Oligoflexia bacterium]|nr:YceI family protein [Oligoflexia bacterium]
MKSIILTLILLFFTTEAFSKSFEINSEHSSIIFKTTYMKLGEVEGRFKKFKGTFDFDEKTKKVKDLFIEIDVKSIDTADKKRDRHLKQSDFFDVNKFRYVTFEGKDYLYKEGKLQKVKGFLNIKGKDHPLILNVKWKGSDQDAWDPKKMIFFFSGTTNIERQKVGLNWNKALDQGGWLVGNNVEVRFQVEANATDNRPAFSRFMKGRKKVKKSALGKAGEVIEPEVKEKVVIKKIYIKEKNNDVEVNQFERSGFIGYAATGFFSLVGLLTLAWLSRKQTAKVLEAKNYDDKKVMILADLIFCIVVFVGAVLTAPFMGYSKFLF